MGNPPSACARGRAQFDARESKTRVTVAKAAAVAKAAPRAAHTSAKEDEEVAGDSDEEEEDEEIMDIDALVSMYEDSKVDKEPPFARLHACANTVMLWGRRVTEARHCAGRDVHVCMYFTSQCAAV